MASLVERYAEKIRGVLSCPDRVVITGTLPAICNAGAMKAHLRANDVRLFDYPRWAEPLRDELRATAERLAREAGLEIEFIRRRTFRKEERVKAIIAQRGSEPGLVHIFSAMEPCASFRPWHERETGKTKLKPTEAKCLHYYFYFMTPSWAWATCGCRPGRRFACSSISTDTTGWPASSSGRASVTR